ncbi:uncharacterized protein EKO05_0002096 [Ascochyta rabiei]|uniref:ATP binding n=1 Tax=Didymella rabiei TaxID=5454 RepID=A0A163C3R9_DIDRA|nr:uncharacterized protein EKO05_0002096 [Ascochyta rabiei]KZM22186.1 ATP binding [Ascochyta rabiei]UPX11491.1 hypothetical protein EKO05_0002096 [Ascochyta rabiei]
MADGTEGNAPPCIAALPPTTVRQIGSHQLLTDPSSVVKELIDNALDARAKSIFVDIATNTIDSVQVKDDGHGIPSEDRTLACRRYCTSKIRDFHDLKEVGGRWLGFRGEALASLADMSGTVSITTRVEGEPVAVKLTYQRNGELLSTERDSHPIGTTVKVTKLLESAKVRKQLAVKDSTKCLAKIRRLMQAYALARPAIRFRLHVLKAKNGKGDFVYAPKADANVEDAALKIIGKDCALQCQWTALEMNNFELHAFLPSPTATGPNIANNSAFISVDCRPVSAARGTLKKIATAVRDRIRKVDLTLAAVKDPFFCLNIICPPDSYDPNVEPAKDNVMFGDENLIINLVDRLLVSHYPESNSSLDVVEEAAGAIITQSSRASHIREPSPRPITPSSTSCNDPVKEIQISSSVVYDRQPRWRSSMYGIDEEDLTLLPENVHTVIEEEEGLRDAAVFNPWTIARMNAPVKPKKPVSASQLPSPVKSQSDVLNVSQSSAPAATPFQTGPFEPLTPQTLSQTNRHSNLLDYGIQRSVQLLPSPASQNNCLPDHVSSAQADRSLELPLFKDALSPDFFRPVRRTSVPDTSIERSAALRRSYKPRPPHRGKKCAPSILQSGDTWFGQPMCSASKASSSQKRSQKPKLPLFSNEHAINSQTSLTLPAAEDLANTRSNNTDIRHFFSHPRPAPSDVGHPDLSGGLQPCIAEQLRAYAEQESPPRSSPCRPRSVDSRQRPTGTAQEMKDLFNLHQGASPGPSSSPTRKCEPSEVVSAPRSASRSQRSRTTDGGLHRTRSYTLPLNFVPHGFETHNLSLFRKISVPSIVHQAHKLDIWANSLKCGYDTTNAFDVFAIPITERKIMQWVMRIDDMLHAVFERIDGVEIRGALHEGIQRFLDTRKAEKRIAAGRAVAFMNRDTPASSVKDDTSGTLDNAENVPISSFSHQRPGATPQFEDGSRNDNTGLAHGQETTAATAATVKSDEHENKNDVDFNFWQFIHLNGNDAGRQSTPVQIRKVEDGFGNGVDDEMLMDL